MKLFSYLLLLPLSIFSGTLDFDEWKLEKSSDNINIYTRSVEGHSLKEFKATTVFKNVTMEEVLKEIYEAPSYYKNPEFGVSYFVEELDGSWVLEKHPSGIKATQQVYMDPGGMVPSFITNSLIVRGPLKTFSALRKTLQQ